MYNIYIAITTLKIHTIIYIYLQINCTKYTNNKTIQQILSYSRKNLTRNQHSEV